MESNKELFIQEFIKIFKPLPPQREYLESSNPTPISIDLKSHTYITNLTDMKTVTIEGEVFDVVKAVRLDDFNTYLELKKVEGDNNGK